MALDDYGAAWELGAAYPGNPADPWRWRALYLLATVGYVLPKPKLMSSIYGTGD